MAGSRELVSKVFYFFSLFQYTFPWKIISEERNDLKKKKASNCGWLKASQSRSIAGPPQVASGRSLPSL